jgi:hypothetical protein
VARTVLFVCPHGALHPQEAVSVATMNLVSGTDLETLLDRQPPRPVALVPDAVTVVSLDCDLPDALRWDLAHQQVGAAMLAELRERVGALARRVGDGPH